MERTGIASCWLAIGLLAAGCDASDLVIERNQAPDAITCELAQARSGAAIERGTFDLALGDRSTYVLTPLVRNRTSGRLTVETAHVTLAWEVGGEVVPLSIVSDVGVVYDAWDLELDACASACPLVPASGTASFEVPVLPRSVAQYVGQLMDDAVAEGRTPPEFRLIASITLVTSSGRRSAPFDFEVRVCLGCLVEFPAGTDAPGIAGPDCCGGGAAPAPSCLPGQDAPIDCRACVRTLPEICNFGRLSCG